MVRVKSWEVETRAPVEEGNGPILTKPPRETCLVSSPVSRVRLARCLQRIWNIVNPRYRSSGDLCTISFDQEFFPALILLLHANPTLDKIAKFQN